jgi:hypothetical protein
MLDRVWNWLSGHWLMLFLGALVYGLELIRRELAEIRWRLEKRFPTEGEARFMYEVEAHKNHGEPP